MLMRKPDTVWLHFILCETPGKQPLQPWALLWKAHQQKQSKRKIGKNRAGPFSHLRYFVFTGQLLALDTFVQGEDEAYVVCIRLQTNTSGRGISGALTVTLEASNASVRSLEQTKGTMPNPLHQFSGIAQDTACSAVTALSLGTPRPMGTPGTALSAP